VVAATRTCRHCGTENLVVECKKDARSFVLTTAHLDGRLRQFDDGPVQQLAPDFEAPLCDYCATKAAGLGPIDTTNAGLRQKTCPVCHTEFLDG
jgi:hypothetical protein